MHPLDTKHSEPKSSPENDPTLKNLNSRWNEYIAKINQDDILKMDKLKSEIEELGRGIAVYGDADSTKNTELKGKQKELDEFRENINIEGQMRQIKHKQVCKLVAA